MNAIPYKKQQGLGLLELLLVLTISALVIVMGFRFYHSNKTLSNVALVRQNVKILLQAANSYYYAYCVKNTDGPNPGIPDDSGEDAVQKAQTMFSKVLTPAYLQTQNADGYTFIPGNFHFVNPFGDFSQGDNAPYRVVLTYANYANNACRSKSNPAVYGQNCFGENNVWYTKVNICVTAFTKVTEDKVKHKKIYQLPSLPVIKAMFDADDVEAGNTTGEHPSKGDNPDCDNGVVVSWESRPRSRSTSLQSGEDLLVTGNRLYNQEYRYGPWMQKGYLATDPNGPQLKNRMNYLCQ